MLTLGTKLLKLRQEHNLSQTEIADILGITQTTYGCWESDKYSPRKENLIKLSQYYNINLHELVDENEKIGVLNHDNDISGGNNIFANGNDTVNIQQSPRNNRAFKKRRREHFQTYSVPARTTGTNDKTVRVSF